jgi:hypothetical protein
MHNALPKVALRTVSVTEGRTVKLPNSVAHQIQLSPFGLKAIARSYIAMSVRINHTIDGRTLDGEAGIHGREDSVQTPYIHEGHQD